MDAIYMIRDLHDQLNKINIKIKKEISYDVIDFEEVSHLIWHRNNRKKSIASWIKNYRTWEVTMKKCETCHYKEFYHVIGKDICQHIQSMKGEEAIAEYVCIDEVEACDYYFKKEG